MAICNPLVDKNCNDIVTNSAANGAKFLSGTITALLAIGALFFVYTLIMGGLSFISSDGDDKKVTVAKGKITGAIMGLVVMLSVFAILSFFQSILGINLIKLKLPTLT